MPIAAVGRGRFAVVRRNCQGPTAARVRVLKLHGVVHWRGSPKRTPPGPPRSSEVQADLCGPTRRATSPLVRVAVPPELLKAGSD